MLHDVVVAQGDFARQNWYEANVSNVDFVNCDFTRTRFWNYSQFTNVTFQNCILRNGWFPLAGLDDVDFVDCDLVHASFDQARLRNVTFSPGSVDRTYLRGTRVSAEFSTPPGYLLYPPWDTEEFLALRHDHDYLRSYMPEAVRKLIYEEHPYLNPTEIIAVARMLGRAFQT